MDEIENCVRDGAQRIEAGIQIREQAKMQTEWTMARDELAAAVKSWGFPKELADIIAKNLGSPKAISRMTSYLCYVKPKKEEIIIDEMLAIMSEISAWRDLKESREANEAYNEMLYYGLGVEDEYTDIREEEM